MGKVEETIGNVTGSESWKTSGQERRVQGDVEHKEARAQGYTEGTKDRLVGKKDQITGAVTGDTSQEAGGTFYSYSGLVRLVGLDINNPVLPFRPCPRRERPDSARLEQVVICVRFPVSTVTSNVQRRFL